jgi:hypothetical protein
MLRAHRPPFQIQRLAQQRFGLLITARPRISARQIKFIATSVAGWSGPSVRRRGATPGLPPLLQSRESR